jgi:chitinase
VVIGASVTQRWPSFAGNKAPTRANIRRKEQCPDDWKGTVGSPKCPQPLQPDVVPAWVDSTGTGIRGIVPQDLSDLTKPAYLEIMYKQTGNNALTRRRSGRVYSCDEFPPASWIEGGVGTAGYVYFPTRFRQRTLRPFSTR